MTMPWQIVPQWMLLASTALGTSLEHDTPAPE